MQLPLCLSLPLPCWELLPWEHLVWWGARWSAEEWAEVKLNGKMASVPGTAAGAQVSLSSPDEGSLRFSGQQLMQRTRTESSSAALQLFPSYWLLPLLQIKLKASKTDDFKKKYYLGVEPLKRFHVLLWNWIVNTSFPRESIKQNIMTFWWQKIPQEFGQNWPSLVNGFLFVKQYFPRKQCCAGKLTTSSTVRLLKFTEAPENCFCDRSSP